jgi:hypothetical protein
MNKTLAVKILENAYNTEKDLCHLIMIPFTGLGSAQGFRGDEWFAKRIKIFKENTLKSLLAQDNPFFTIWICFREEEAQNPLTMALWEEMKNLGLRVIFTFGGIMIWDDKYPDEVEAGRLLQRFKDTLPELKRIVGNAKYVYETILASDDMYAKDVVSNIHRQEYKERRALVHWHGYVRNIETGQIGEWLPGHDHLPPFYTIMYPADTFLDPQKHFDYLKGYKSHEHIEGLFENVVMPDGKYMVNTHGNNISTSWMWHRDTEQVHPLIGKEFTEEKEKKNILKQFGLCVK